MPIDMHCHLYVEGFRNENSVSPFWDRGSHTSRTLEDSLAEAKRRSALEQPHFDPDGSEHIKRMDEAGIEKSIILHVDQGLLFGEAEMTIEQQNKHISEVVGKYPDRLIWFCGIDPRREQAVELLEKCVNEWGARGIKMYPTTGFLPADKECYAFYERATSWEIPVYFHMGPENPPYRNEGNAHAAVLLRVLVDFPDLTVIAAHLGYEFWRDLIALGKVRDNIMCDFCAWQRVAKDNYGQFCHILRQFLDEFGSDRVLFGTDAPILEDAVSSKEWVQLVRELPEKAPEGYRFTEDEVSALLDDNARTLLASIPTK
jgi:predicted TIM-barrel fold metal-dependent hydrolase